jgi:hypothetical protein
VTQLQWHTGTAVGSQHLQTQVIQYVDYDTVITKEGGLHLAQTLACGDFWPLHASTES